MQGVSLADMRLVAAGNKATNAADAAVDFVRNCTLTRAGVGDYTVTFAQAAGFDATERQVLLTPRTALAFLRAVETSDLAIQILSVTIAAGNAALEASFYWQVWNVPLV